MEQEIKIERDEKAKEITLAVLELMIKEHHQRLADIEKSMLIREEYSELKAKLDALEKSLGILKFERNMPIL